MSMQRALVRGHRRGAVYHSRHRRRRRRWATALTHRRERASQEVLEEAAAVPLASVKEVASADASGLDFFLDVAGDPSTAEEPSLPLLDATVTPLQEQRRALQDENKSNGVDQPRPELAQTVTDSFLKQPRPDEDTIQRLLDQRQQCRQARDFAEADKIRDMLRSWGVGLNGKVKHAEEKVCAEAGEHSFPHLDRFLSERPAEREGKQRAAEAARYYGGASGTASAIQTDDGYLTRLGAKRVCLVCLGAEHKAWKCPQLRCFVCFSTGHSSNQCPKAQTRCRGCGRKGHDQSECLWQALVDAARWRNWNEVRCANCGMFGHPMCTRRPHSRKEVQSSSRYADCYDAGGFYAEPEVSGEDGYTGSENHCKVSARDHRGRGCGGGRGAGRGAGRGRGLPVRRDTTENRGDGGGAQTSNWARGHGRGSRGSHRETHQERNSEYFEESHLGEDVQQGRKRKRQNAASLESEGTKSRRSLPKTEAPFGSEVTDLRSELRAKLAQQQGRNGTHSNGHASKVRELLPEHLLQTSDLPLKVSLRERKTAARVSGILR